ncbi:MAG: hypothetical protein ACR2OM_06285, partial [Aestuariivirgaceae bacterium]
CHETGFGELDLQLLNEAPEELRLRVLQTLVWQFGNHEMPRLAALERLMDWIGAADGRARTVSGCRIVRRMNQLLVGREPGRVGQMPVRLSAHNDALQTVWDRRFCVKVRGARAGDDLSIVPFGAISEPNLGDLRSKSIKIPAFVRESLPVLRDNGALHSVPHLGIFGAKSNPKLAVDLKFMDNQPISLINGR